MERLETMLRTAFPDASELSVVDRTGTAHPSGPDGLAGATPLELVAVSPSLAPWASFPGRWSEG